LTHISIHISHINICPNLIYEVILRSETIFVFYDVTT